MKLNNALSSLLKSSRFLRDMKKIGYLDVFATIIEKTKPCLIVQNLQAAIICMIALFSLMFTFDSSRAQSSKIYSSTLLNTSRQNACFLLPSGDTISLTEFNDSLKTNKYRYELLADQYQCYKLIMKEKSIFSLLNHHLPVKDFIDLKGDRVLMENGKATYINFWSLSCPPCITELAVIDSLSKIYPHVNFLAIADDPDEAVKEFAKKHKYTFTFIRGGATFRDAFFVDFYPTHLLVDEKNIVRLAFTRGLTEKTRILLEDAIKYIKKH